MVDMTDETKLTNIERLRQTASIFLREDLKVYIKDIYNGYHFCKIFELRDDWVIIKYFKGNRMGETNRILWIDIEKMVEYKEEVGDGTGN